MSDEIKVRQNGLKFYCITQKRGGVEGKKVMIDAHMD